MQIKTLFAAAVATLAPAFVSAQAGFCPEAARFGVPIVTPTTLAPGDPFTVVTNFTCSFSRGIIPLFVDYWIEVPVNNNGHEPNILLARKTFEGNASFPIDSINTTVPFAFYFPNTTYNVVMDIIYSINGTDGNPVNITGGVDIPIDLQLPASS